jgi:hypothetical protein
LEEADRARGKDPMPPGDIWAALRSTKGEGGSAVADVYVRDDPVANPVPIAEPADARAELARTGDAAMVDMRDEGFHDEAHEAWAGAIFGTGRKWPTLLLDGRPWTLEEALADDRLDAALRRTAHKAVGADGFDVVWLRMRDGGGYLVPEGVRKHFYAALRVCAANAEYPAAYREILYVLLKKDGVDSRVIRERREIALYCTPLKLMLSTVLRGVADVSQSQIHGEQAGWTEAMGAIDAAILRTALHEQALNRPGYACILFLDL